MSLIRGDNHIVNGFIQGNDLGWEFDLEVCGLYQVLDVVMDTR